MKRLCVSICAALSLLALSPVCIAQSNPWNGSWKLDPSSLKYEGSTYSVATDDGFTVTRGGEAQPKVVCDGKEHKSANEIMLTCTKSADGHAINASKDGKTTRKTTISVSEDGKTRTGASEFFPPDGDSYTMTTVSERVSGGPGNGRRVERGQVLLIARQRSSLHRSQGRRRGLQRNRYSEADNLQARWQSYEAFRRWIDVRESR